MKHLKVTGIILKRRNVGEADMLLTVLTKELGKITMKAKGIRKITSRRGASLDLLNFCTMSLYEYNHESMRLVTEVVLLDSYSAIKSDLMRVGIAYHLCELLEGLCAEEQANTGVFALTQQVFEELGETNSVARTVHAFEIALLNMLGYVADQDLAGGKASLFIEDILERRLKARQVLPYFL